MRAEPRQAERQRRSRRVAPRRRGRRAAPRQTSAGRRRRRRRRRRPSPTAGAPAPTATTRGGRAGRRRRRGRRPVGIVLRHAVMPSAARRARRPGWRAPSPISSMPAASSAAISFISESTLPRMTPSLASMRWMVGTESPASSASCRWSMPSSARAARSCAAVIMSEPSEMHYCSGDMMAIASFAPDQ